MRREGREAMCRYGILFEAGTIGEADADKLLTQVSRDLPFQEHTILTAIK